MFIVANLEEKNLAEPIKNSNYKDLVNYCEDHQLDVVPISIKMEEDMLSFSEEEKEEYLKDLGIQVSSLNQFIKKGYEKLNLISFFTTGIKESRSWVIKKGDNAKKAASKIHSDIEKGFISVDVISYSDFIKKHGKLDQIREEGLIRIHGKDYIVLDTDILNFKFNI